MSLIFLLTLALPIPAFWNGAAAYRQVLGFTPRIVGASLLAYFAGEFSNALVLSWLKLLTKGKWLWTRTIGSTIVGEGVDTFLVIFIAFAGQMPWTEMAAMILANYLWKVGYEVIATPITYFMVGRVKRFEQIDVYDYDRCYNPF